MGDQRENRDNEPRNPIADLWRLCEVERWQIVHTAKKQTVAEHSYMVALLASRIAEIIDIPVGKVVMYALLHDAEEAWTGDIPAPMKRFLDSSHVPVKKMLGDMIYWTKVSELERAVVKLADLASDACFLFRYGNGGRHSAEVRKEIEFRMNDQMAKMENRFQDIEWKEAFDICVLGLYQSETHLDDYIGKKV